MAPTNDYDDLSSLSTLARKRVDPKQQYASDVLQGETTSPYGILAKGIAGAMIGRQAGEQKAVQIQQQQLDLQERVRVARILQNHQERGFDDDFTFKALLQDYAMTGSKVTLNIAGKLKPKMSSNPSQLDRFTKAVNAKRTYIAGKFPNADLVTPDEIAKLEKEDPQFMWINQQIEEIVSGKESQTGSSPTTGTRQDTNKDVNGFEDVARLAQSVGTKTTQSSTQPAAKPQSKEQTNRRVGLKKQIAENMRAYGKSRAEVVAAMKKKGIL